MSLRGALLSLVVVAATAIAIHADRLGRDSSREYAQARRAADLLEEDLLACFPFTGSQTFTMDNSPANRLSFMATTVVGTTRQSARITYFLSANGDVERRPR